jgi:hypothetical protein
MDAGTPSNVVLKVDFARDDRAPLLFAAFGEDHAIPAKASRHNAEKPGWEEVADYALDWALQNARRS